MERSRIVCIVGPTACKKTALSVALAQLFDAEIVSADSVSVYKGMDIGSAKPTMAERQGVTHHMLDCAQIDMRGFSVEQYAKAALASIADITARGKIPMVVGGSGLYINALTFPLHFAVPSAPALREALSRAYDEDPEGTYARLCAVDAVTAGRVHPNDKKRVVRALEIFDCSGRPLSSFGADFANDAGLPAPTRPIMIGLTMERGALYARIDARVDAMLERGLLDEARRIYDAGYDRALPAMQSIGYRQLFSHFDGEIGLPEAVALIKRETRRFAKRQMTWFKRDTRIRWFTMHDENDPDADARARSDIAREIERGWSEMEA